MGKYFSYIFFIVSTLIIMMNTVNADAVFGSVSSYGNGSYETCGSKYNGCIGIYSYRYTIVKDVSIKNSGVTYNKVSGTSSYEKKESSFPLFTEPSTIINNIKTGGTLFKDIIKNTGVSMKDFFGKGYQILVEVRLAVFYSNSGSSNKWPNDQTMIGYPSEIANQLKNGKPHSFTYLTGLRSVTKQIPCYLYLSSSGSSDDNYCVWGASYNYKDQYLNMATNNSRYGKGLVYASQVSQPNGSITITKKDSVTGSKLSGVGFTLYSNSSCSTVKKSQANTNSNGQVTFSNLSPGTYYYKETKPPTNYVASSSCTAVTVYPGTQTSIDVKNAPYGSIVVNKVNTRKQSILNATINFDIYKSAGCLRDFYGSFVCETNGSGSCTHSIPSGNYWIKETSISKDEYVATGECVQVGTVVAGGSTPVEYVNKTQCEIDFEKDSSIKNRLTLYSTYGFKNLLNFNKLESYEACSDHTTNYGKTEGCLVVDQVSQTIEDNFNETNLSDYNDTITANSTTGHSYCLTDFELNKHSSVSYNPDIAVKAGRMVLELGKDQILADGTITKTCYIHNSEYSNYNVNETNFININDYISTATLDGIVLSKSITPTNLSVDTEGEFYKVEGKVNIAYLPNPVYAEKITGMSKTEDECIDPNTKKLNYSCKILGYGVASKFNDAIKPNPSFSFSISNIINSSNPFSFEIDGNLCPYKVEEEIIKYEKTKGNLHLEFRVIDTNNPFGRKTNANWSDGSDNSFNNSKVQKYITNNNVNNSYNRTGQGSLYTNQTDGTKKIILTPDIIQKIRDYNNGTGDYAGTAHVYNDYTNYTKDVNGKEITSTEFFDYIELKKVTD